MRKLQRHRHRRSDRKQRADKTGGEVDGEEQERARRQRAAPAPAVGERQRVAALVLAAQAIERFAAIDARRGIGRRRARPGIVGPRTVLRRLADQPQQQRVFVAEGAAARVFALILAEVAPVGEAARRRQQRLGDRLRARRGVAAPTRRAFQRRLDAGIDRQPRRARPIPPPAPAAKRGILAKSRLANSAASQADAAPPCASISTPARLAASITAGDGGSSSRQISRARPGPR